MKLLFSHFMGEMPQLDPSLLQPNNATRAYNLRNDRGTLEPLHETKFYRASRKPRDQLSIYRFAPIPGDAESGWLFTWDRPIDCVPGPIAGNTQNLTYWTGEDYPRYTDNSLGTGSEGPLPQGSYRLGVEAPEYAPTVVLIHKPVPDPYDDTDEPDEPDEPDDGEPDIPEADDASTEVDRDYVITYVQQLGSLEMEGPPSEPTAIVTVPSSPKGYGVKLTNLPLPPSGPYPWGHKRVYRRIYSGGLTKFALVAEIATDKIEYDDVTPDAEIPGDQLISDNFSPPLEKMHSLGVLSNGLMYGAHENDVCVSEPYLPHAWNPFARYPLPYPVIGMGHVDNQIVAVTARNPYMVVGVNPANMNSIEMNMDQGCLAKRSIISGSFGCIFASPDGLILVSAQGSRNITDGLMTRQQWQALNPSSMISATNEDLLIVTFIKKDDSKGSFILDPGRPEMGIRFTDQTFTAAHHDGLMDSLLVYDPSKDGICLWDEGETLPYTWRSKLHLLPVPACFTAARVQAENYDDLTFRLLVDDAVVHQQVVTDNTGFRLPSGYQSRSVQIEISGTDVVRSVCIAEAPHELE